MSDKLQPCPFCGDVNPSMQGQTDRTLSYEPSAWVECETCGAQSRGFCRTSEAMEAWNRRATSPARDNEGGQRASTPDGIDLAAQIAHQKEIFCGDCATFGDDSKWSIKSGSILASLIELQDARAALSAAEQRAEAMGRDAARYRWLNSQDHFMIYIAHSFANKDIKGEKSYRLKCGECLDSWIDARIAAIDAALASSAGNSTERAPAESSPETVVVPREVATHRLDNGAWRVFIGHICVASWIGSSAVSDGGQMMVRPEIAAKQLAAKINAEILGVGKAFGCEHEARGGTRCGRWCGYEKCPVSMASPGAQKVEL